MNALNTFNYIIESGIRRVLWGLMNSISKETKERKNFGT